MKLSKAMFSHDSDLSWLDIGKVKEAQRIAQVKYMWAKLVDEIILEHTNAIFIFKKNGKKLLHVYMDDSLFASELNASRELLRLRFLEQFNEQIDEFHISVSRGKYKNTYPFRKKDAAPLKSVPLSPDQKSHIEALADSISDPALKESFKRAMTADLERINSTHDENDPQNL